MSAFPGFPGLPPVDRRLFIPDDIWMIRDDKFVKLSRGENPTEWERVVASEDAITTQLKNSTWPTSSSSAPSVMAQMIAALEITPAMRVLEIGTGTGYNAACLAALGADVVTVEIDEELATQARNSLEKAGYANVTVITGDGENGVAANAPFDRVIATAAVHTVPYAWVEQTKDDGLIVVPYTGRGHEGAVLILEVNDGTAIGGVSGEAAFMPLRGQRMAQDDLRALVSRDDLRLEVSRAGQRVID